VWYAPALLSSMVCRMTEHVQPGVTRCLAGQCGILGHVSDAPSTSEFRFVAGVCTHPKDPTQLFVTDHHSIRLIKEGVWQIFADQLLIGGLMMGRPLLFQVESRL
jgi:hypothetical protein